MNSNQSYHNEVIQFTVSDIQDQLFLQDGELWCYGDPSRRTKKKQVDHYIDDRSDITIFTEQIERGRARVNTKTAKYILVHSKMPNNPVLISDNGDPVAVTISMFRFYNEAKSKHIYKQVDKVNRKAPYMVRLMGITGQRLIQTYSTMGEAEDAFMAIVDVTLKPEMIKLGIYESYMEKVRS